MERSIVLNIRGGARICVPPTLEEISTYVLLEQEDWFEDEIRFVRGLLAPGGRAVDIGANYGTYTLALAASGGSQCRIWAFEPTPATADYLEASLRESACSAAQVVRRAVSSRAGTAHLAVGAHSETNALAAQRSSGSIEVATAPLDELARELDWHDIEFVKIDAEGHEPEIVDGGKAFFAKESPLVMLEIASGTGPNFDAVLRLRALGYGLYRLVPGLGLLRRLAPGESLDPATLNLFCCKPDRAQALRRAGLLADGGDPSEAARALPEDPVACHRAAASRELDPDSRIWLLRRAMEAAQRELAAGATLPRLATSARLARDLGERMLGAKQAAAAADLLPAAWSAARGAPCLVPDARFESVDPGGDERAWLECALIETSIELGAWSSIYVGAPLLPILGRAIANPFRAPRTLRAWQLVRMREGLQQGPEPHPLLSARSESNLNPEFWQSRAKIAPGGSR